MDPSARQGLARPEALEDRLVPSVLKYLAVPFRLANQTVRVVQHLLGRHAHPLCRLALADLAHRDRLWVRQVPAVPQTLLDHAHLLVQVIPMGRVRQEVREVRDRPLVRSDPGGHRLDQVRPWALPHQWDPQDLARPADHAGQEGP